MAPTGNHSLQKTRLLHHYRMLSTTLAALILHGVAKRFIRLQSAYMTVTLAT